MQQVHIAAFFTIISSNTFMMKISWNLSCAMIMFVVQFWKKLSKEEGRISALYLYMNFKLSWYKSETWEF